MAEKYGRGRNPNSLANLKKGHPLKSEDGSAKRASDKAAIKRRTDAERKERAAASLDIYDDVYFTPHPLSDIKSRATDDELTQQERLAALRSMNPKTADEDLKWYYDRVLGKPTQVIDNNLSGDLNVSKPSIVFNDVEGASRKGEEERLQSEEEDI